jgi:hypothetical protein
VRDYSARACSDRVIGLIESGTEPLNELLSALRTKAPLAELESLRESRRQPADPV